MSFFTPVTTTITLDGDGDNINTVTLSKVTHGKRQDILVRTAKIAKGDALVMGIATQGELLKASIIAWDGPGFEGKPVTPENIEALPSQVADEITEKASEFLTGGADDDEKKD